MGKILSLVLFVVGTLLSHAYLMFKFLWELVGLPGNYPLVGAGAETSTGTAAYIGGTVVALSPFIGGLLMIVSGLLYGRRASKEAIA